MAHYRCTKRGREAARFLLVQVRWSHGPSRERWAQALRHVLGRAA